MNSLSRIWLVLIFMIGLLMVGQANYLRIQNVVQDQAGANISFELAWNNSWRIDSMGAPYHWDAAWVFVKWRDCNAGPGDDWIHGEISTIVGDHSFANLEPTLSDGTTVGIDANPNNLGVMLRRGSNGFFPNQGYTPITLHLDNFPATGEYEVRVFGIEMVFVPQGSFLLGGNTESSAFHVSGNPVLIDNENSITLYGGTTTTLPAAYPKGFNAFFCMKYEISQAQYSDFLNTIRPSFQSQYFTNAFNSWRNRINSGGTPPDIYFSDRPDRAQNYLAWYDLTGYLDWAALRPMTELEYEKACRGPESYIQNGLPWGSINGIYATTLQTPEDGTELVTNADANVSGSNITYSGGDGGRGPVRVGIFATAATTTRQQTGASYYGIMELGGNVWEQCVSVHTNTEFINYDGQWGNGYLDPTNGWTDVPNWPYLDCSSACRRALRGGSWADVVTSRIRTSDRYYYYYNHTTRSNTIGGRGVR